jgi:hypothetical protein
MHACEVTFCQELKHKDFNRERNEIQSRDDYLDDSGDMNGNSYELKVKMTMTVF